jgi:hypothetical protein
VELNPWWKRIGPLAASLVAGFITGRWNVSISFDLPTFWSNPKSTTNGGNMPPEYTYFKPEEVVGLDPEYVSKLDLATAKTAELDVEKKRVPFIIASGFRTPEKNESIIGAVPDSSHLKGLATDLVVSNDHEVWLIVAALRAVGITRIGIYVDANNVPTHVHNDVDPDKVPQVIWIKREGQANSAPTTA